MKTLADLPASIAAEYRAGATLDRLSRKYRCSVTLVLKALNACGQERRSTGIVGRSLPDSIAQEYRDGATVAELSEKYRTHYYRVVSRLRMLGVEPRKTGHPARNQAIAQMRLDGKSLRQIGQAIGISSQRVHQILCRRPVTAREEARS